MSEEIKEKKRVPWYLWPFWAIWRLVGLILAATGRLVAVILGLVFLIVGVVLTVTVIGAIVGAIHHFWTVVDGAGIVLKIKSPRSYKTPGGSLMACLIGRSAPQ
jgi:hypothetical protein